MLSDPPPAGPTPRAPPLLPLWAAVPAPRFVGGNTVELLQGGDKLFPRLCQAINAAQHEVWLATYIFHIDRATEVVIDAMTAAAARGVAVHVVVDGFGCLADLPQLRARLQPAGVRLEVFRPLDRWYAWLQPGQLRRLHQKLCACDGEVAFVGGINLIDDRHDLNHGWTETPRLDWAVAVRGPLATAVQATTQAMWLRAQLGHGWRRELRALVKSRSPLDRTRDLLRRLRVQRLPVLGADDTQAVRAAFVVRDNLRQRRTIERSYVQALRGAERRIDIAVPYFYPGRTFRRALRSAAQRGVQVRLLLQGKADYRIAALAAQVQYEEMRRHGIRVFEYTPAFLHAKVAVVDDDWATVGSSNIDPLSLLLNLEANVVVRDEAFACELAARMDAAFAVSLEVTALPPQSGWRGWMRRALVAWVAQIYLRVAGITGRY